MRKITGFLLFAMIFCCLTLNQALAVAVPTVQASNISVSQDASDPHSVDISFTTGNGGHRIVVIGTTAYGGSDIPTTDIIYTDVNGNLNTAPTMNGNKKVIDRLTGSGMTTVTVTLYNLIANTTYYVKVFEYNTDGVETKYLNSGATNNPKTFTTYKEVDVPVLVGASQISTKKASVTWEDVSQIGATDYYLLYLYTSSCDGDMVSSYPKNVGGDQNVSNENIWQMIDLTPNTTYYWAIAPVVDGVTYPKSLCGSFTTNPLVAPQVVNVWAEAAYINKGNGSPITSFWIKVRFNQEMETSVVPTISFPGHNPTSPAAVLYNRTGGWENTSVTNDTYKYIYQVNTAFSLEMYDIDIDITNAETEDGQTFTGPHNALDVFSIDLIPPTAVFLYQRLNPNPTAPVRWIGENQSVRINATFSEALKLSPMPELNIAPQGASDLDQVMTYLSGSDFKQFYANYNVPLVLPDLLANGYVVVTIIDGQDRAGNEFLPVNGNNEPPTGSVGSGVTMIVDVDPPNTADIIFPAGGATLEDQIFKFGTNNSAVDKTIKKVNGTAIDQVLTLAPTANNTIPPIFEVQYLLVYDANDDGIPNASEQYWNGTTWVAGPAIVSDWADTDFAWWKTATGTSDWEFEFPTSAADGRYLVYTYAIDMALNGAGPDPALVAALDGSLAGAISFYIDNTPPVVSITNPTSGYADKEITLINGNVQELRYYKDANQPQWSVFYDINENGVWDISELYYDGTEFTTSAPVWFNPTTAPAQNDVSNFLWDVDPLALDIAISDLLTGNGTNQGDFVLTVKATDYVGNVSTANRTFRIDTQEPEGTLSYEIQRNGAGPFVLNANPVVKDGDVVKIIADIDESLDGTGLTIELTDPDGGIFSGQNMDNISSPLNNYNKYHYIYNISGITLDDYFDITFDSGQDPAGNPIIPTPAAGTGQLLLVDNTDPVVDITVPTHMTVYGPTLGLLAAVSGTASDVGSAIDKIQVAFFRDVNSDGDFNGGDRYWNQASLLSNKWSSNVPVWYDAVYSAGNWSIDLGDGIGELDLADLWDTDATFSGRVVISARALDLAENMVETTLPAGNAAGESRTIIIDKTPPAVTITAPYDAVVGSVVNNAVVGSIQGGTANRRFEGTYIDYEDGEVSNIQIAIFKDNNWNGTFDGGSGDRWFNTGNSLFDQNVAGPLWFNVSNPTPALPNQIGTWYHNLTLDNDTYAGKYTVVARAMDDAGNISTTFSYKFEINRTKPEATVAYKTTSNVPLTVGAFGYPEVRNTNNVRVVLTFDLPLANPPIPQYTRTGTNALANINLTSDVPATYAWRHDWNVSAGATSGMTTISAGAAGESVYGIPVKTATLNNQILIDNQAPTGTIAIPIAGANGIIDGSTTKISGTAYDVFQNGVRGSIAKVEVAIYSDINNTNTFIPGDGDRYMNTGTGDFDENSLVWIEAGLTGPVSNIWSWSLSSPYDIASGEGHYFMHFRVTDLAGNVSTVIDRDFFVDGEPPVIVITEPNTGAPTTFPYLAQLLDEDDFNGTITDAGTISVDLSLFKTANTDPLDYTFNSVAGDRYANAVMNTLNTSTPIWVNVIPDPGYSFETDENKLQPDKIATLGGEGWYVYTVRANDGLNETTEQTKFYLDLTNPTITVDSPTENQWINTTNTNLTVSGNEDLTHFQYTWNNITWYTVNPGVGNEFTTYSLLVSDLTPPAVFTDCGTYTVYVRAYDRSGRVSNTVTRVFNKDNTNPHNVAITAPVNNQFVRDDFNLTFTADDNCTVTNYPKTYVSYYDGTVWSAWEEVASPIALGSITGYTSVIAEGAQFNIKVKAVDAAGNETESTVITNLTRDNTPPTVTITREAITPDCGDGYNTNANSVQFTLDFSEALTGFDIADITVNATGVTFTPLVGGNLVGPDVNNDYVLTITGVDGNGTLGITVVAAGFSDLAGNQMVANVVSALFTIDNTLPVVAITDPAIVNSRVRSVKAISFTATDTHTLVNEVSIDNTNWVPAVSG